MLFGGHRSGGMKAGVDCSRNRSVAWSVWGAVCRCLVERLINRLTLRASRAAAAVTRACRGNSRYWSSSLIDKDEIYEAKLWDADGHHNRLTKRQPGAQLVTNLNFKFPQVVRQHTLGVVGRIIWVLFTTYSSFQRWKNFENRLGFVKVIAISWVVHFFGRVSNRCIDVYTVSQKSSHLWTLYNFVKS